MSTGPSESSKLWTESRFRGVDGLLMLFFSSTSFLMFPMSFLMSSRSLLGSILNSQIDSPTFENDGFYLKNINIFERTTFAIQRWFWKRFGALAGAFWELQGIPWGLSRASKSTQEGFQIHPGTILGLGCSLLAVKDGLGTVLSSFGTSRGGF